MAWGQFLQPKQKGQNTTEVLRSPRHQNSGNPLTIVEDVWHWPLVFRFLITLKGVSYFLWPKPMELFAWTPVSGVHLMSSWISLGSISYLWLYRKLFENWAERLPMVVISPIHMSSDSSVWSDASLMFPSLAAADTCKHRPMAGGCRAGWPRWSPAWLAFGLTFRGNFGFLYITDTGSSRTKGTGSSQHVPL